MNDPRLPPDEAASAFLDGELGPEEAEAVREHPGLAARARALRRAADAVGEDVVPPPGAADAAVEAAMADFDARLRAPADMARRRPRGLAVITGVAAAVAIGFIVAAAVGLFAERESDIAAPAAAPAPPPSVEAADAAAPLAAPEPPPPAESPVEALAVPTTALPQAVLAPPPAAAPLPAPEPAAAQADAEAAMAEAEEASAAQAEAAAAQPSPPPAAEPPPPADADMEALDDAGPAGVILADLPPGEACAVAIGDRTVELRLTVGGTPILILGASDGSLTGLDGTTCAEIPAPDGSEVVADEAADGCAGAIGDGTVELRLNFSGTRVLVIRTADGSLIALDGTTCGAIPTG